MSELDTSAYTPAHETENNEETETNEEEDGQEHDEVDPEQVQTFLDHLEYVINNAKDEELIEKGMEVIDDITDEGNAEDNVILKKYQCLKCNKIFPTRKSYRGHYHGKPDCGETPRWMSDYDDWEDQMNIVRV